MTFDYRYHTEVKEGRRIFFGIVPSGKPFYPYFAMITAVRTWCLGRCSTLGLVLQVAAAPRFRANRVQGLAELDSAISYQLPTAMADGIDLSLLQVKESCMSFGLIPFLPQTLLSISR